MRHDDRWCGALLICSSLLLADPAHAAWGERARERRERRQVRPPTAAAAPRQAGDYQPGQFYPESLTVGGQTRTYRLYIPKGYHGGSQAPAPYPLVLSLHGGTSDGQGQSKLDDFALVADRHGFLLVYPNGLYKEWNDGRGFTRSSKEMVDDVGFVTALLAHLQAAFSIDARRIYATGFSEGAVMSHRLGCELTDRLAAIAPVSGMVTEPVTARCAPSRPLPVVIFHGTGDPLAPYTGGLKRRAKGQVALTVPAVAAFWASKNGCQPAPVSADLPDLANDGTTVTRTAYRGCAQNADVVLYAIHEGGHAWAGGPQYLPKSLIGRASRDVQASTLIWEFFERHRRP